MTTGDGSCLYHTLSLTLTGTEAYSELVRLLAARALVKYKDIMIRAFRDIYQHNMHTNAEFEHELNASLHEAVNASEWGTDHHLFALSLLLDRPIFHYNSSTNIQFTGVTTPQQFAQSFLSFDPETRYHYFLYKCAQSTTSQW